MTASPFRLVVAGYDGSPSGDDALALGALLAGDSGRLVAARVFTSRRREESPPLVAELERAAERFRADTERPVARSPAAGLHDLAQELEADLLVVGSSDHGAGPPVAGGTGERLLHGSPCAVALAPPGFRDDEQRLRVVGAGYDGSPEADIALGNAIALAEAHEATMRIFTVLPPVGPLPAGGLDAENPGVSAREHYQRASRAAQERAPDSVRAAAAVVPGDPAIVLREESEKGIDLLTLGSRGFGPLRRTFLGSVAASLMHGLSCPLVVFPRGAEQPRVERLAGDP